MKTKEFIKRVEELGYEINEKNFLDSIICLIISNSFGRKVGYVAINKLFEMNIRPDECMSKELFDLVVEYAKTPIKDREEEKRYYLKHRYLQSSFTNLNDFLSYSASDNKLALSNGINFPKYKTHFTLKEIEEIKEKFNTDLEDFEIIEVKDEN